MAIARAALASLALSLLLGGCAAFPERGDAPPGDDEPPAAEEAPAETEQAEPAEREEIETAAYVPQEPERLDRDYPRQAEAVSGPAVTSLHQQAMQRAESGETASAIAVLERALRIEPRNAFVWTALAEQHLAADDPGQAQNTAERANGFARGNPFLEARNWRVIAEARRDSGDQQGADQARDRAEQARMRQSGGG